MLSMSASLKWPTPELKVIAAHASNKDMEIIVIGNDDKKRHKIYTLKIRDQSWTEWDISKYDIKRFLSSALNIQTGILHILHSANMHRYEHVNQVQSLQ